MIDLLPAFLVGFVGSLHCLGMCGPIALAVPKRSPGYSQSVLDSLAYNLGRVVTYAILGAMLGLIGSSLRIAGWQEYLSVVVGGLLLLTIIIPKRYFDLLGNLPKVGKVARFVKRNFKKFIAARSRSGLVGLGLVNGLLPCGLVYFALAASFATADVGKGAAYMALFGLGTIPMMGTVFILKDVITTNFRRRLVKFVPVMLALVATLMILRGLSLGIPYVSPKLSNNIVTEVPDCCH